MKLRFTFAIFLGLGLFAAAIIAVPIVNAYEINPLKNKFNGNRSSDGFASKITDSVHEDITDLAVQCAELSPIGSTMLPSCPTYTVQNIRPAIGNKYNALIRGVWWNDDPNQNIFGVHYATWVFWMNDAALIAKRGKNWLGQSTKIGPQYKMQYRSHYGDLQFLHAMANDRDEAAVDVQKRIINWMEFAYSVATKKLDAELTLADVKLPMTNDYFVRQSGWTINHLFAPKFTLGRNTIKDVALGSMLHIIQDSYSRSHATRDYNPTRNCPLGRMLEFHAYNLQNAELHGAADTHRSWQEDNNLTVENNPVQVSAQIINFAKGEADWATVVEPYLREKVFCIDLDARPSTAGNYGNLLVQPE